MNGKNPRIRLLPTTIGVMAALMAMKSAGLVQAAFWDNPGELVISSAMANGHEAAKPAEKKPEKHSEAKPEAKPAAAAQCPPAPPPPPPAPTIPDSERAVLLELRERRQELENREATLAARESVLAAAEQKVTTRVTELTTLQRRLEALESGRSEREEASWQGLVKVYEAMKPQGRSHHLQ